MLICTDFIRTFAKIIFTMLSIDQISKELNPEEVDKEARLDIRLNMAYKLFLQQVYKPAGFRSLSAFILQAAIEKAEDLIEKEKHILASERDKTLFFTSLLNQTKPNEALRKAAKAYKKATN